MALNLILNLITLIFFSIFYASNKCIQFPHKTYFLLILFPNIFAFYSHAGMTSVLLVGAVGQARYLTHIARTHMMPPWFAQVNAKTGTPVHATVTMMAATAVIGFFTDLSILSNLLSISTLFIFMLVALALLVRRYYVSGVTTAADRNKLVVFLLLILGSSIATAAYWGLSTKGWVGYCVTVPIWLLATIGLWATVPHAREAKLWGVPLVPWLPSASIAINIFLLGSIDKDSFIRFGVWTGLLLLYYVFFGLHASYDTAKEYEGGISKVEEGDDVKGYGYGDTASSAKQPY